MRLNPVLILDTETTALDPKEGHCIEVAVSLYDTEAGGVLESYSSLIRAEENPAVHVNRITPSLLRMAPPAQEVWARIRELGEKVDLVLAHNASFDRAWAVEPQNKRWICTMHDLAWSCKPDLDARMSLVQLLLAHGLGVSHAHRAAVDVESITRLLDRVEETRCMTGISILSLLAGALAPRSRLIALVNFAEKEKPKAKGFSWNAETKEWCKSVPSEKVEEVVSSLGFKVRILSSPS